MAGSSPAMTMTREFLAERHARLTRLPMHDWNATARAAQDAEAAGFSAVMTVELGHDVFAPLAIAAMATDRVELTPSVAVAFPRSPTVLASQAWDLQANSRGRFVLRTWQPGEGPQRASLRHRLDRPCPTPARLCASAACDLALLGDGRKTRLHSEHYTLTLMMPDFSPEPTGLPMVPVTLAAVGEAMLRVAGQVADGVRLHPLCSRRYLEEVCLPQIADRHAEEPRTAGELRRAWRRLRRDGPG